MIIMMRRGADSSTLKLTIDALIEMGWDVQVKNSKNGEGVVVAALGSPLGPRSYLEAKQLSGVESCETSNDLFVSNNGRDFVEAWEWICAQRA